jgi:hypothetical protein
MSFDSSALKMEASGSCETLVPFYETTWCHIPKDSNHLKIYMLYYIYIIISLP